MSAETRIVMGILDEPFERDQEAKLITLAAGALAAVAAVGNREPDLLFSVLKAITETDQTLSQDAQTKLRQLADELVASVRFGKRFVGLAGFRRGETGGAQ